MRTEPTQSIKVRISLIERIKGVSELLQIPSVNHIAERAIAEMLAIVESHPDERVVPLLARLTDEAKRPAPRLRYHPQEKQVVAMNDAISSAVDRVAASAAAVADKQDTSPARGNRQSTAAASPRFGGQSSRR